MLLSKKRIVDGDFIVPTSRIHMLKPLVEEYLQGKVKLIEGQIELLEKLSKLFDDDEAIASNEDCAQGAMLPDVYKQCMAKKQAAAQFGGTAGIGVQVGAGGWQVTGTAGWNGQNGNISGTIGFGSGGFSIGIGGVFRFAKDGKEKTIYVDAIETSEGTIILPTYTKGKFDNFKSCLAAGAVTLD